MSVPRYHYASHAAYALDAGVRLWGGRDDERLTYDDLDEFLADYLDQFEPGTEPESLIVAGYRPMVVRVQFAAESALENLLESIDEEYGDPDGEPATPTDGMRAAAEAFVAAVVAEYRPWAHEAVIEVEVDVNDWKIARRVPATAQGLMLDDQERHYGGAK